MKKLHLVCNAHLDPVWMWNWDEGAVTALATYYAAVELAEEYDYIVVNDVLDEAVSDIASIITSEQLRVSRQQILIKEILG